MTKLMVDGNGNDSGIVSPYETTEDCAGQTVMNTYLSLDGDSMVYLSDIVASQDLNLVIIENKGHYLAQNFVILFNQF